jgi:hypothetical protein
MAMRDAQALVSSTLRDLVIGSGLEFEDRGAHGLKGVPEEWHIFAVGCASEGCIPQAFPYRRQLAVAEFETLTT